MLTTVVPSSYFRWKRIVDCVAAMFLLPVVLPLLAVLVVLVRLTSRGRAIFPQLRVGKNGRTFVMYKIRTMREGAETITGPVWSLTHDPRTTRLGKALRKLHLDELPQIFNVLRGDMSLVGPRPERPEFVRLLAPAIPGYANRMAVQPGITGLAQLNLPPDSDLESVYCKLLLDCEYIGRASLWLDCRLLLGTALRIIPRHWPIRMLRLKRTVAPPAGGQWGRFVPVMSTDILAGANDAACSALEVRLGRLRCRAAVCRCGGEVPRLRA